MLTWNKLTSMTASHNLGAALKIIKPCDYNYYDGEGVQLVLHFLAVQKRCVGKWLKTYLGHGEDIAKSIQRFQVPIVGWLAQYLQLAHVLSLFLMLSTARPWPQMQAHQDWAASVLSCHQSFYIWKHTKRIVNLVFRVLAADAYVVQPGRRMPDSCELL